MDSSAANLEILPAFLEFKPPFAQPSTEKMTLTNASDKVLAFKVKTTAPKLYCVRPNASTIAPGEKIEVQIILQGMKQEPPANYKCTDKFMVVSLPCPYEVTGEDAPTVAQIWPKLEKEFKRSEKKIRVIFKNTGAAKRTTPVASEPVIAKENIPVAEPVAAPVKDKDLTESQKKIDQLNEKLDVEATKPAPEVGAVTSGAKTTSSAVTPQASSLPVPLAILGGLIALILAWLFF